MIAILVEDSASTTPAALRLLEHTYREAGFNWDNCRVKKVSSKTMRYGDIKSLFLIYKPDHKVPHKQLQNDIDAVWSWLHLSDVELIVAHGDLATYTLNGMVKCASYRGSQMEVEVGDKRIPMLPTYAPSMVIKRWDWRPVLTVDLKRAHKMLDEGYHYPDYFFTIRPSAQQCIHQIEELLEIASHREIELALDIETIARHLACLGIAWSSTEAICIPFITKDNEEGYFSLAEELLIIEKIQELQQHPNTVIIGQNYSYDTQFYARFWGYIPTNVRDTMTTQHTLFPGMPKSLDFLSSMYCDFHLYWKDELKDYKRLPVDEHEFWVYNCVGEDTQILLDSCQTKAIKDLEIGERLLTFEEESSGARYARKFKTATVQNIWKSEKEISRYTFSDGTYLDATKEHKIFTTAGRVKRPGYLWRTLGELSIGDIVVALGDLPGTAPTYDDAWFAGILDGEGTLGIGKAGGGIYPRLSFCQVPGLVLDRCLGTLVRNKIDFACSDKHGAIYVDILGGLAAQVKVFNLFKTSRLSRTFRFKAQEGYSGFAGVPRVTLTSIEPLGSSTVYDIQTTEGTFIANGLFVHNCKDCVITWEVWQRLKGLTVTLGMQEQVDFQQDMFYPIMQMMLRGTRMNLPLKQTISMELLDSIYERDVFINDVLGESVNVKSPKQMQKLFYEDLGLPVQKARTPAGYRPTTNSDALQKLAKIEPLVAPIVQVIDEIRSLNIFLSNFANAPLDRDNRIRCSYNVSGTETFRLSSSKSVFDTGANLQTIPAGNKKGD